MVGVAGSVAKDHVQGVPGIGRHEGFGLFAGRDNS